MQKILKEKRDFSQLEDFNKGEKDDEYQQKYFENLARKKAGQKVESAGSQKKKPWKPNKELSQEQIDEINKYWDDSPTTSQMWELISQNRVKEMIEILSDYPEAAHARSADGRGPLFWVSVHLSHYFCIKNSFLNFFVLLQAYEFGNEKMIRILKKVGVSDQLKDEKGMTALDLQRGEL